LDPIVACMVILTVIGVWLWKVSRACS